ncbi:MAG TPA: energy transducer TonB [Bacteroidia bacterium]|nr:energy transducer TonB [Bacteroidia bacterium]
MSDINPGYPSSSWMTDYISAEISVTGNGKVMKAGSANEILSVEQKSILKMADLGTDIVIDVKYKQVNTITGNIDIRNMHFLFTVVPEIEAEYPGGYQQMKNYLKENAINKISETDYKQLQAAVKFTVSEEGEIANAQISKTSGDKKTDKLLVEAINKMPKWRPAENSKGLKVKQEFVFSVGNGGC